MAINLNEATHKDLVELKGIGTVLAGRILAHRDQTGHFAALRELLEIDGVSERLVASLANELVVSDEHKQGVHHSHAPPGGAKTAALSWHHFHRPPGADERGTDRLAKLELAQTTAGRSPEQAKPDRAPLLECDPKGKLSSPDARSSHDDIVDLLNDL